MILKSRVKLRQYQKDIVEAFESSDCLFVAGDRQTGITTTLVEIAKMCDPNQVVFVTHKINEKMRVESLIGFRCVVVYPLPRIRKDVVIVDNAAFIEKDALVAAFPLYRKKLIVATTAPLFSDFFCRLFVKAETKISVSAEDVFDRDKMLEFLESLGVKAFMTEFFGVEILRKFDKFINLV